MGNYEKNEWKLDERINRREKDGWVENKVNIEENVRECHVLRGLCARLNNHEVVESRYNSISFTSGWMNWLPGVQYGWGKKRGVKILNDPLIGYQRKTHFFHTDFISCSCFAPEKTFYLVSTASQNAIIINKKKIILPFLNYKNLHYIAQTLKNEFSRFWFLEIQIYLNIKLFNNFIVFWSS